LQSLKWGGLAMGSVQPLDGDKKDDRAITKSDEMELLREENRQLRELVIQLSKIVIKNVVDQK
jgi:hypothetical protein